VVIETLAYLNTKRKRLGGYCNCIYRNRRRSVEALNVYTRVC
jgi:hypothetical protein